MPKKSTMRKSFSDELRTAIDESGLTRYGICQAAGIDKASMSKFMTGERGLGMESIDKLAELLGLHIMSDRGQRKRKG